MKVFLSWSGERSKALAIYLKSWLPSVIQALRPFCSSEDIAKGRRWTSELATELEHTDFGIIILTPENLKSPFIHFEAGALSKNQQIGHVTTLLFELKDTDVESPLADFQNTKLAKEDVFHLIRDLNNLLGEAKLDEKVLENTFNKMWGDLEQQIDTVKKMDHQTSPVIRLEREMIEEILEHVRKLSSESNHTSNQFGFLDDFTFLDNSPPTFQFKLGDRVFHDSFGEGVVKFLGGKGEKRRAVVDFPKVGRKHLLIKFAQLKPIS